MINRILIVDDEPLIRSGLSRALYMVCDFIGEIKTVESGSEAISEAANSFYDICFLDVNLPDSNGLDVMEKIRAISPGTMIAIMTASFISDEMKVKIENNASLFVPKPMDLSQIRAFIDQASRETVYPGNKISDRRERALSRLYEEQAIP